MSLPLPRPQLSHPREIVIGIDPATGQQRTATLFHLTAEHEAVEDTLAAEARRTARLGIAGLLTGLAMAALVDWLTGGPGIFVMVGL